MTRLVPALAAVAMLLAGGTPLRAAAVAPPAGGSISIEAKTGEGRDDPATRPFVDAASDALAARGFTILEGAGHAAYVAELIVRRAEVGTGTAKIPAGRGSAEPGGAFGSVGAGVVVPLRAGTELVPLRRTEIELRIRKRDEQGVIWDGTAMTVRAAGTRKGADEVVAADLSEALLRAYPAQPEGVVGVP